RTSLLCLGPHEHGGDFSARGMSGVYRFLHRVWDLVVKNAGTIRTDLPPRDARQELHRTIQKVSGDLESLSYNTAIAALMEYLNLLQRREALHDEEARCLLLLLAPLAPHFAEELWARLGKPYSVHQQAFPRAEP